MADPSPDSPVGLPVARIRAMLGCSKQKVYNLIDEGYLEVFPGPGVMLVTTASWERYLASAGPRSSRSVS